MTFPVLTRTRKRVITLNDVISYGQYLSPQKRLRRRRHAVNHALAARQNRRRTTRRPRTALPLRKSRCLDVRIRPRRRLRRRRRRGRSLRRTKKTTHCKKSHTVAITQHYKKNPPSATRNAPGGRRVSQGGENWRRMKTPISKPTPDQTLKSTTQKHHNRHLEQHALSSAEPTLHHPSGQPSY